MKDGQEMVGTVLNLVDKIGGESVTPTYGFIFVKGEGTEDRSIFFHRNDCVGRVLPPVGSYVRFTVHVHFDGKMKAKGVYIIPKPLPVKQSVVYRSLLPGNTADTVLFPVFVDEMDLSIRVKRGNVAVPVEIDDQIVVVEVSPGHTEKATRHQAKNIARRLIENRGSAESGYRAIFNEVIPPPAHIFPTVQNSL